MLLLVLFVVGAFAQPDFNNDDELPPFVDGSVVIYNDDAASLPGDVRRLLGSTQYGRPMPYGHHGLVKEGGAGIGEDYADGRIFGIDIDPNDIDLNTDNNDDGRGYTVPAGGPSSSSILSLLGIDTRPLDTSNVPPRASSVETTDDDDDDDYFDLSQYGIGTDDIGDETDSMDSGSTSSGGSGIDLSDFGIGISPSTSSGAVSYSYGEDDDKKDDGADDLGPIDLSQFGIYYDETPDDKPTAAPLSSSYSSDDSEDSSYDLSQYGIGSGSDSTDGDDDSGFDISDYLASLNDDKSDDAGDDSYDLSQFGIGSDGPDIPGVDFMPYLSAYEKKSPEKTLIKKEASNDNQVAIKEESKLTHEMLTFNDLGINIQNNNATGDRALSQNKPSISVQDQIIPEETQLPDPIYPDIPYLQNLIGGDTPKSVDHTVPGEPVLQESIIVGEPKVDPVIPSTQSSFLPETYFNDLVNSSVEYAIHSDIKQDLPIVRGFDIIKTEPFDWQKLVSNSTFGLSDSLRKWIQR